MIVVPEIVKENQLIDDKGYRKDLENWSSVSHLQGKRRRNKWANLKGWTLGKTFDVMYSLIAYQNSPKISNLKILIFIVFNISAATKSKKKWKQMWFFHITILITWLDLMAYLDPASNPGSKPQRFSVKNYKSSTP